MTDEQRPSWEWLLTSEERALLDSIESISGGADVWNWCNHCEAEFRPGDEVEHKEGCPVKVARLFAQRLVGWRNQCDQST